MAFAQALSGYFGILTDWGFNLSATRQVSIARNDPNKLNRIFLDITLAKFALFAGSFCLLAALAWTVPILRPEAKVLLAANTATFGSVLFPGWLFQGLEIMYRAAAIQIVGRVLGTALLLIFIHSPEDIIKALLIQSGVGIAAATLAFISATAALPTLNLRLSAKGAWSQITQGTDYFLTSASISLYTVTNSVVLGFLAGKSEVAFFSPAEKITRAASDLIGAYGQATFPAIEYVAVNDRGRAVHLIRKSLKFVAGAGIMASFLLSAGASTIVEIFFGSRIQQPITAMMILAPLPLLIACSNIFAVQTMIPFGMSKAVRHIVVCAGLINVALLIELAPKYGAKGAALSVLVTEIGVTLATGYIVLSRRLLSK